MKRRDLELATPCKKTWDELEGDSPTCRFCTGCEKKVHNLSQLSEQNARTLVDDRVGELCVVYQHSRSGTVKHRSSNRVKRFFSLLLLLLPISPLITACGGMPSNRQDRYLRPTVEFEDEEAAFNAAESIGIKTAAVAEGLLKSKTK